MKRIFLCVAPTMLIFSFISFPHDLTGTWMSKGSDSSKVFLKFDSNGNFKVTVGNSIENQGHYVFKNDTFTMYDANCGLSVGGKYKLTFFTEDSVSFTLINDSCKGRAGEVDGGRIKRIN
jgi:hypothetical protein